MPTIYITALRTGSAATGSLEWYWRLRQPERRAADARTRSHIDATYGTSIWGLSIAQSREVYKWARAHHA